MNPVVKKTISIILFLLFAAVLVWTVYRLLKLEQEVASLSQQVAGVEAGRVVSGIEILSEVPKDIAQKSFENILSASGIIDSILEGNKLKITAGLPSADGKGLSKEYVVLYNAGTKFFIKKDGKKTPASSRDLQVGGRIVVAASENFWHKTEFTAEEIVVFK